MLKPGLRAMRGFTLVELMLALGILGILIMMALPSLASWIQNTQLRTAAEGMHAGLTLARAEALRRNTVVQFQVVDTLTSSCGSSATGTNWVISLADATGASGQGLQGIAFTINHANTRGTTVTGGTAMADKGYATPSPNDCWVKKKPSLC